LKQCSGGIRTNIFFPQCWDGVNLDSPDHSVSSTQHCLTNIPDWLGYLIEPCGPPIWEACR
jgi:hypothetical protein